MNTEQIECNIEEVGGGTITVKKWGARIMFGAKREAEQLAARFLYRPCTVTLKLAGNDRAEVVNVTGL